MNAVAARPWVASASAQPVKREPPGQSGTLTWVVLLACSLVMAAVAATGSRPFTLAVAPLALLAGFGALFVGPIRLALFFLIFFGLGLDAIGDGPWDSPLAPFGALFAYNSNVTMPVNIPVPGAGILMLLLLVLHAHRTLAGSPIDGSGRANTPNPLLNAFAFSAVVTLFLCIWGWQRGGDMKMAKIQVQHFVMMLMFAYLAAIAFRDLRDYRIIGRLVVAAACIKALMAMYVVAISPVRPEAATTHGDSVLFACAAVLLVVRFAERPGFRPALWCGLFLPVLLGGMVANDRRIVWVEIAASLVMFWLVSRRTRAKRFLTGAMLAASPLILAYVIAGWNSEAKIFAPLAALRSTGAVGETVDSSTLYRDTENYNLLLTLRYNPYLGAGFGQEFAEYVKLPDISFFAEYKYLPHNSILGLWAFTGAFGFTALFVAIGVGVFFAARSYNFARSADERVAAFMVLASIIIWLVHSWGDIGFSERKGIYLVGPALAMAGHLATATGAWRGRAMTPRQ